MIPKFNDSIDDLYQSVGYEKPSTQQLYEINNALNGIVEVEKTVVYDEFVTVYKLAPNKVYKAYLDNRVVSESEMVKDFIDPFKDVIEEIKKGR